MEESEDDHLPDVSVAGTRNPTTDPLDAGSYVVHALDHWHMP